MAALATPALAARVKVRVEGKTTTIFGATEPALTSRHQRPRTLDAASLAGEFYYHVKPWALRRPDRTLPRGRLQRLELQDQRRLAARRLGPGAVKDGDTVLWYWATFSEQGSTPTLVLRRRAKANCYSVVSQNDRAWRRPQPEPS